MERSWGNTEGVGEEILKLQYSCMKFSKTKLYPYNIYAYTHMYQKYLTVWNIPAYIHTYIYMGMDIMVHDKSYLY